MNLKNIREDIVEFLENEEMTLFDDCDDAIIGVGNVHGDVTIAVYCYDKLVDIFVDQHNMEYDSAIEWVDFNIVTAYVGETTPLILQKCFLCCD
jgi:hypothetical protein|tara:strand:- start:54 stop:335 length:282 start_codon:yes stop_codon:yes gene_type:complete